MRKASGHVVCRLDQSALFRIFDSTFTFHIPQFHILPIATATVVVHTVQRNTASDTSDASDTSESK